MRKKWKVRYELGELHAPNQFWDMLQRTDGRDLQMTVEIWKPYTSNEQYKFYYGVVLQLISDETGHSVEELDLILKNKYLYEFVKIGDEVIKKPMSKTKATVLEFSKYLEEVMKWGAETLNIVFPEPEEVTHD